LQDADGNVFTFTNLVGGTAGDYVTVNTTSTNTVLTVTATQPQLLLLRLATKKHLFLKSIVVGEGSNWGLQGASVTRFVGKTFQAAQLRKRGDVTRDNCDDYDSGKKHPSVNALAPGAAASGRYLVTAFGVKHVTDAVVDSKDKQFHSSADTTVSSTAMAPHATVATSDAVSLLYDSNQTAWKGVGTMASLSFTSLPDVPAAVVTLFFSPTVDTVTSGSPAFVTPVTPYASTISIISGSTNIPVILPAASSPSMSATGTTWTLHQTTPSSVALVYPTVAVTDLLLLPYVQLTYEEDTPTAGGAVPPSITSIVSGFCPMQAFSTTPFWPVAASDVQGPAFDFQAVQASNVTLFRDHYGNAVPFAPNVGFFMQNQLLNVAVSTSVPIGVNSDMSTVVGSYMTEQRVTDGGTWYTVPLATTAAPYAPTRYHFEEYVPQAGEYTSVGPAPTSVILLFAENRVRNKKGVLLPSATGYVACATGSGVFAPTSVSFAGPLLTKAEAVAQCVQWGFVTTDMPLTPRGISMYGAPALVSALMYKDSNLPGPSPLMVAGGSTSDTTAPTTSTPTDAFDLTGNWLAHGVLMTPPAATVYYNPETLLVSPKDHDNVITGTGFTPYNQCLQWTLQESLDTVTQARVSTQNRVQAVADAHTLATVAETHAAAAHATLHRLKRLSATEPRLMQQAAAQQEVASTAMQTATVARFHANVAKHATHAHVALTAASAVKAVMQSKHPSLLTALSSGKTPASKAKKRVSRGEIAAVVSISIVGVMVVGILCVWLYKHFTPPRHGKA
jgi:hypothetical protein